MCGETCEAARNCVVFPLGNGSNSVVTSKLLTYSRIILWGIPNHLVLDDFMGSGTVARMCEKMNRAFIGFQISKEYCELTEKLIINIKELGNKDYISGAVKKETTLQ